MFGPATLSMFIWLCSGPETEIPLLCSSEMPPNDQCTDGAGERGAPQLIWGCYGEPKSEAKGVNEDAIVRGYLGGIRAPHPRL